MRAHIRVVILVQFIRDRRSFRVRVAAPAVCNHQPLTLPWDVNVDLRVSIVRLVNRRGGRISKYASQKLEDTIYSVLVFLVPLPRSHGLLPKMLVRLLEFIELG